MGKNIYFFSLRCKWKFVRFEVAVCVPWGGQNPCSYVSKFSQKWTMRNERECLGKVLEVRLEREAVEWEFYREGRVHCDMEFAGRI